MTSLVTKVDTTWASPITWNSGDPLTAGGVNGLNAQLRDKLNALKTKASFYCFIDQGADYTYTSSTYADIDSSFLSSGSMVCGGGLFVVWFTGTVGHSDNTASFAFDFAVDGTRQAGDDGAASMTQQATAARTVIVTLVRMLAISSGSHTITLQWKTTGATVTLYAGAGAATMKDVHPQFGGFEI